MSINGSLQWLILFLSSVLSNHTEQNKCKRMFNEGRNESKLYSDKALNVVFTNRKEFDMVCQICKQYVINDTILIC